MTPTGVLMIPPLRRALPFIAAVPSPSFYLGKSLLGPPTPGSQPGAPLGQGGGAVSEGSRSPRLGGESVAHSWSAPRKPISCLHPVLDSGFGRSVQARAPSSLFLRLRRRWLHPQFLPCPHGSLLHAPTPASTSPAPECTGSFCSSPWCAHHPLTLPAPWSTALH